MLVYVCVCVCGCVGVEMLMEKLYFAKHTGYSAKHAGMQRDTENQSLYRNTFLRTRAACCQEADLK